MAWRWVLRGAIQLGGREIPSLGNLKVLPDASSGFVALAPRAAADLDTSAHQLIPDALACRGMRILPSARIRKPSAPPGRRR